MGRKGRFDGYVDAPATSVFAAVGDLGRLAEWNRRIVGVTEAPERLERGAEWVVEVQLLGQTYRSRSSVLAVDPGAGLLRYRSNPDGDPDFSIWTWVVTPEGPGCRVAVEWDLHPVQLVNRVFWARLRSRQLRKELPASIAALERLVTATATAAATGTTERSGTR